jgi:hypothetical protein
LTGHRSAPHRVRGRAECIGARDYAADCTFAALLFVSHAALIGSKVFDKMAPGTNPAQT